MTTDDRHLRTAAAVYGAGLALHTADHLRRGLGVVTGEVLWAGNASTALGILAVVLVAIRHPRAPEIAALTGFPVAIGVAAVHLLPHWSAFSDAFPGARETGVTWMSWVVVLIEIAGAIAMGVAGALLVRARRAVARPLTR
jgi:hypothetical protein